MSDWITRDQARNHFRKRGLTYRDVKRAHIHLLLSLLDIEFEASRNNPESRDNVSPRINDKIIYVPSYENGSEIGMQDAYLYMKGAYFSERECISFNLDGFIGFAGWASDGNVQPILRAFIRWCDLLAGDA